MNNEHRPNLGLHPNVWNPKELRTNLDRNQNDITMTRNIINKIKTRISIETELWQNLGWYPDDQTKKLSQIGYRQNLG